MESVLHKNLSFLGNNILTLWGGGVRGLSQKLLYLYDSHSTVISGACYRLLTGGSLSLLFYLWSPISALLPPTHSLPPKLLQFTSPQVGQLCKGLSSDQLGKNW